MKESRSLNFLDAGRGPAVLLLHDALLTPVSWTAQVEGLARAGFRVIVPDLSACLGKKDLAAAAGAVAGLLKRLGIGRLAACGAGMGGSILLSLLEQIPQRLVGACFINTRPGPDDIQEKLKRAEIMAALTRDNDLPARHDLLKMLLGGREEFLSQAVRNAIGSHIRKCDKALLLDQLRALQARKNYVPLLDAIAVPTLIVSGRDDVICHPGYAALMESRLPNCSRVVKLEGGHLLQLEQAAAVTVLLIEFFRSIAPPQPRRIKAVHSLRAA